MRLNFHQSKVFGALLLLGILCGACAKGNCRQQTSHSAEVKKNLKDKATELGSGRIFVYKYDGSLQCQAGKGRALSDMEKELKELRVYSKQKKSDNLMRMTLCGAPTGVANLYEISAADEQKASNYGFKLWTFD